MNYKKIIRENLQKVYTSLPRDMDTALPARKEGHSFFFRAFGQDCRVGPDEITLSGNPASGPTGLLVSLYALHVNPQPIELEPFKSFKDIPGSMPYQGAFSANTEKVLVPYVVHIKDKQKRILDAFSGERSPGGMPGDLSLILYPLPKIALWYIFYLPDEEFPATVTCLFSANALSFMPLDGLADVAEYTSKRIIDLVD